jgi:predicted nucleic acid-binding Zn ribbon protein
MPEIDSKECGEKERREKINRRLLIFGVLVVLFSFIWHVVSAFLAGGK